MLSSGAVGDMSGGRTTSLIIEQVNAMNAGEHCTTATRTDDRLRAKAHGSGGYLVKYARRQILYSKAHMRSPIEGSLWIWILSFRICSKRYVTRCGMLPAATEQARSVCLYLQLCLCCQMRRCHVSHAVCAKSPTSWSIPFNVPCQNAEPNFPIPS